MKPTRDQKEKTTASERQDFRRFARKAVTDPAVFARRDDGDDFVEEEGYYCGMNDRD